MSPFQSAGNFVDQLGKIFEGVVKDKLKVCVSGVHALSIF